MTNVRTQMTRMGERWNVGANLCVRPYFLSCWWCQNANDANGREFNVNCQWLFSIQIPQVAQVYDKLHKFSFALICAICVHLRSEHRKFPLWRNNIPLRFALPPFEGGKGGMFISTPSKGEHTGSPLHGKQLNNSTNTSPRRSESLIADIKIRCIFVSEKRNIIKT